MKKYLFTPLASFGYFFPAIKIAHILQQRGENVLFASAPIYGPLLQIYGIHSVEIRNQKNEHPFLMPGLWYSDTATEDAVNALEQVINHYRPDVIVSNPLALASFVVAERHTIPNVITGFCEYLYPIRDSEDTTGQWRIGDMTRHYNNCRLRLNLEPIAVDPINSPLIGDKYLLRNIPQLKEPNDLPAKVSYVGGLYWEPGYINHELMHFIRQSQRNKLPLVYVQIGRLFQDDQIWSSLVNILERLPMNFIVDVGRADYMRNNTSLPSNFYVNSFIPLGKIADDIQFVLCSGQSTTVISAIIHGKAILSIPHAADAIDLSKKIQAKGLGTALYSHATDLQEIAIRRCIDKLEDNVFQSKVQEYQKLFLDYDDPELIFKHVTSVLQ
ncbi:MAG: hypothetical protein V3T17_01355 [Pseudomonadales bacterium]